MRNRFDNQLAVYGNSDIAVFDINAFGKGFIDIIRIAGIKGLAADGGKCAARNRQTVSFRKLYADRKCALGRGCFSSLCGHRAALYRKVAVCIKGSRIRPCVGAVDMLAGVYKKRARAVCLTLYCKCPCGINTVNVNWILLITILRCRRTAADNMIFRSVSKNNGRTVGQLYRSCRRGGKVNAFQRKCLGVVVPG